MKRRKGRGSEERKVNECDTFNINTQVDNGSCEVDGGGVRVEVPDEGDRESEEGDECAGSTSVRVE